MIKHIVLLKFKPSVTEADKQAIYASLRDVTAQLPGILSATFGPSVSPEGHEKGFNDGFVIEFETQQALQTYLDDADHKVAGGNMVASLEGGVEGLIVFDLAEMV